MSGSLPPSIVLGRPARKENMPAKGREMTSRYCSTVPAGGSLVPGGLSAASCLNMVGTGRGLAAGGSNCRGFYLLARETCALRMAPGTTCVAPPKITPAQALSDPLPGDAQIWLPTIWYLKDATTI